MFLCALSRDSRTIRRELRGSAGKWQVYHCRITDSTNTQLMKAAQKGRKANRNCVLIADRQTGGRGRRGRSFFSPAGTGLYMSLLLYGARKTPAELTTAAAVAVAEAIRTLTGKNAVIKWVNDIWIDGKKVCGILTEGRFASADAALSYAVIGIGVNLSAPADGFPPDLDKIVTTLEMRPGRKSRNQLAVQIINRIVHMLEENHAEKQLNAYRAYSFLPGKAVTVYCGNDTPWEGRALEILPDYRLCVENGAGERIFLDSGEVTVRML